MLGGGGADRVQQSALPNPASPGFERTPTISGAACSGDHAS